MEQDLNRESIERIIKMLTHAVSHDETRHQLGNVQIVKVNDEQVLLSACDGHILSDVKLTDQALATASPCYIHRDQLAYLKLTFKDLGRHMLSLGVEVSQGKVTVNGREITNDCTSYPNLAQLRPSFEPSYTVGLNCELLLDLCKSLNGTKSQIVKLEFNKDNISPIKVTANGNSGVLMPCRV